MPVSHQDRETLRRLAHQVAAIAALPVQQETIAAWKALNRLQPVRPMVMIDQVCWHEMDVDGELAITCEDPFCQGLEGQLRRTLYSWHHMPGDMVIEPVIDIGKAIGNTGFGVQTQERTAALDPRNGVVGHLYLDQIRNDEELEKIQTPRISHDEGASAALEARARELFDGILTVRMQGAFPAFAPWDAIVQWRGVEGLLYDLADRPDFVHRIIDRLTRAHLAMLDQLESQGLLGWGQATIHCSGAWTDELPAPGFDPARPRARDLWTCGMAQIFSTVGPDLHDEFELAYARQWYARFGRVYYGCCEPLDGKIDIIRRVPGVRKISMSPWVDQERGAAAIAGDFVFSRKPSPACLAIRSWQPESVEADLRQTLAACRRHGCPVEFILKDISTVAYQPQRLWQWAQIAARLVRESA
jgi:hypothetical protein